MPTVQLNTKQSRRAAVRQFMLQRRWARHVSRPRRPAPCPDWKMAAANDDTYRENAYAYTTN
jgi:hypothetical protein